MLEGTILIVAQLRVSTMTEDLMTKWENSLEDCEGWGKAFSGSNKQLKKLALHLTDSELKTSVL